MSTALPALLRTPLLNTTIIPPQQYCCCQHSWGLFRARDAPLSLLLVFAALCAKSVN